MVVLIDAMNVLGSRPDGWWRDRDAAVVRLVGELGRWAADRDDEVVVVADGHAIDGLPAGRHGALELVYAERRDRDAADDVLVARVAQLTADAPRTPGTVTVITADGALRERVRELGATVRGPRQLLAELAAGAPGAG